MDYKNYGLKKVLFFQVSRSATWSIEKKPTLVPIFLLLTQINVNKFRCVAVNKDILHVTVAKTNHITNYRKEK